MSARMLLRAAKRRRLRAKTPPPRPVQAPLTELPDWAAEEDAGKRGRVYLITLPHPRSPHAEDGTRLVAPETLTKEQILACLFKACGRPEYTDPRCSQAGGCVRVARVSVWRELHQPLANGEIHAHVHLPFLAEDAVRFLPVKRALLHLCGLASHWSCSHDGYWSAIRYCARPSPKKPVESLDTQPLRWPLCGAKKHPPPEECCHEPMTARAIRARRLAAEAKADAAGGREPRVTEVDVYPLVVQNNFRNTADDQTAHLQLIAFAKEKCSRAMWSFLFRIRARLPTLIDDIWRWENVVEEVGASRQTRWDALRAARDTACVCAGKWGPLVEASMAANGISAEELCRDVAHSLQEGRGEQTPVVVLAGAHGGEGKSLFLKCLFNVFGEDRVFNTPEVGKYPLLDLPGKKVVFLDDWRFDDTVLSFATQCRWFDGSAVAMAVPQNRTGMSGHIVYRGTAPIFVTTSLDDLQALREAAEPRRGAPGSANASMLLRRLKVYEYTVSRGPGGRPRAGARKVQFCARCFSRFVLMHAA